MTVLREATVKIIRRYISFSFKLSVMKQVLKLAAATRCCNRRMSSSRTDEQCGREQQQNGQITIGR
jgi:hypothetical protein